MSKRQRANWLLPLALGLAAVGISPSASGQTGARQAAEWNRPVAPHAIAGPIHYVGAEGVSAYLIATPDGLILIDGGLPETAPLILNNIRALGHDPRRVKYLLVTHAHFDHAGGLAELKSATGAELVAVTAEREALEQGRHVGDNGNGIGRFAPVTVDRVIADGGNLSLGGVTLTAHVTPGHTKGCTSWTLPLTDGGRRHQAIFFCSTSVAGNVLVGNRAYPEIVSDYRRGFARLRRLQADIFLPNHPSFADLAGKRMRMAEGAPNPFVDRTELRRFVDRSAREFEAELARQKAAGRR